MQEDKEFITESMGIHNEWYEEAVRVTTKESLVEFVDRLMNKYSHDMNTIVHAMVAGSLATINTMNSMPDGRIGPAQCMKLLGSFVRHWARIEGPAKIVAWAGLLHVDNEKSFTTIPAPVFEEIKVMANELLKADLSVVEPRQVEHLISISKGNVPFGLSVEEEVK